MRQRKVFTSYAHKNPYGHSFYRCRESPHGADCWIGVWYERQSADCGAYANKRMKKEALVE